MQVKPEILHHLEQKGAIIPEKNSNLYTIRLRIPGGIISTEQLLGIGRAVRKRGLGAVHLTVRQTIEIPSLPLEKNSIASQITREDRYLPGSRT